MRIIILGLLCTSLVISSCGNGAAESTSVVAPAAAENDMAGDAPKYTPGAKMDPVCEMEWDNEWTEKTVYNGDTVRFCSEGCKNAFVAHPDKYIAAGH
ncbi:MAG: YHS domain-containing protein [Taibaiella sp.]|nr:YHS domain-containing protein [Taibaiella sp.]